VFIGFYKLKALGLVLELSLSVLILKIIVDQKKLIDEGYLGVVLVLRLVLLDI